MIHELATVACHLTNGGFGEQPDCADYLHKADISGGPPYGVFVPDGRADPTWRFDSLHSSNTFVSYLRATISDGALPGWRRTAGDLPPQILSELVRGLEPF